MPDHTPVTDDDREAHEWCDRVEQNPNFAGDKANAAARAIRAHVPAPPKSLAEEVREALMFRVNDTDGEGFRVAIDLSNRVEALSRGSDHWKHKYDEDRAEAKTWREQNENDCEAYSEELAEARAEVEQWKSNTGQANLDLANAQRKHRAEVERLTAQVARQQQLMKAHGAPRDTVILPDVESTPALPDPADVPEGELWAVTVGDLPAAGYRDSTERFPWSVIFADDEGVNDDYTDSAVTLVSRLVPDTRRVVDQPEVLDALPVGSIVLDEDGDPWKKLYNEKWWGGGDTFTAEALARSRGPVTVIHEPEVTA